MKYRGGDNSISSTFQKVGDVTGNIGDTVGNVVKYVAPEAEPVINTITNVAKTGAHTIGSIFKFLGLGEHLDNLEHHMGLGKMTKEEAEHYNNSDEVTHKIYEEGLHVRNSNPKIAGSGLFDAIGSLLGLGIHSKIMQVHHHLGVSPPHGSGILDVIGNILGLGVHHKRGGTYDIAGNKRGGTYDIGGTYYIAGNSHQKHDDISNWIQS